MDGHRRGRRLLSGVAVALVLSGCGGSPSSPPSAAPGAVTLPPAPAPAPAPSDRHGGRNAAPAVPLSAAVAPTWPSGVPLPGGDGVRITTSPGAWMATMVVDQGLDAARASVTDLYRNAGFTVRSTAPDMVSLTTDAYRTTISLASADHSPTQTQVVVHLSTG